MTLRRPTHLVAVLVAAVSSCVAHAQSDGNQAEVVYQESEIGPIATNFLKK